jgi:hypothetical protein
VRFEGRAIEIGKLRRREKAGGEAAEKGGGRIERKKMDWQQSHKSPSNAGVVSSAAKAPTS